MEDDEPKEKEKVPVIDALEHNRKEEAPGNNELTDANPSSVPLPPLKKAPRIGGAADVDNCSESFAPTHNQDQGNMAHQASGGLEAQAQPAHGVGTEAPQKPVPVSTAAAQDDEGNVQETTHESQQQPGLAPAEDDLTDLAAQGSIQRPGPPTPDAGGAAGERRADDNLSVLEASVAAISSQDVSIPVHDASVMGEVYQEPPLAEAAIEHCWTDRRKRITFILAVLIVIVGLVLGIIFGLRLNDDSALLVTQSPSMQPSAAPTNTPLVGDWTQLGRDLVGEANGDWFGLSIAMSADGNIVAVGAPRNDYNDTSTDSNRGSVHVFIRSGTLWNQLGGVLRGENEGDVFGWSVALSADGTVLAVGAPWNDDNGEYSGQVRVFQLVNDDDWAQVGSAINGKGEYDEFGNSVALSSDGMTLAVGAIRNSDNGLSSGQVRIFQLANDDWSQVGSNLNDENDGDRFGRSVALSADGTVLAVGAPDNGGQAANDACCVCGGGTTSGTPDDQCDDTPGWTDSGGDGCSWYEVEDRCSEFGYSYSSGALGQVRTFQLVNDDWTQIGSSLNGENADDGFGESVALSSDGTVLAVGARQYTFEGLLPGYARVFRLVNNEWLQVGSNLNGENGGDEFGNSVALSADGTVLAAGAHLNDDNGSRSGHVRIFQLVNDDWAQVGSAINGKGVNDYFGWSVALSADGKTVAGGAIQDDLDAPGPGYVLVHHLEEEDE